MNASGMTELPCTAVTPSGHGWRAAPAARGRTLPSHRRLSSQVERAAVLGNWQLGPRIGGGGSRCEVYLARPVGAADDGAFPYAIKWLRQEVKTDADRQRFRNEALLARRVEHPHVIAVLCASLDTPPLFYVMPRLSGSTVAEMLERQSPIAIPHALWIARQMADALAAIHQAGWIHGDVQPGNIHVSADWHATLIDLGCAVPIAGLDGNAGKILAGHLCYVAPEQLTSRHQTTPASDVYSLGLVLYEMLTLQRPSHFSDPARTAEFHLRQTPPSIRTWLPTAPRELAQLVGAMLAKDPARRPSVQGELSSRLARLEIETFTNR